MRDTLMRAKAQASDALRREKRLRQQRALDESIFGDMRDRIIEGEKKVRAQRRERGPAWCSVELT